MGFSRARQMSAPGIRLPGARDPALPKFDGIADTVVPMRGVFVPRALCSVVGLPAACACNRRRVGCTRLRVRRLNAEEGRKAGPHCRFAWLAVAWLWWPGQARR